MRSKPLVLFILFMAAISTVLYFYKQNVTAKKSHAENQVEISQIEQAVEQTTNQKEIEKPKQELLTSIPNKPVAPSFELPDEKGDMFTLADFRGKPVIINYWATWCPPCRAELPSMNRGWEKIKDEGIEMLAVNIGEDEDTIFAFTAEHPINFRVLLDKDGQITSNWPIQGLPTTYVLDKEGRLVYVATGEREWDSDEILNKVRALR